LRRHRAIGKAMARRIVAAIPDYEAAGAEVVADLESLAIVTSLLLGQILSGEIVGDRDDLAVIRERVARRVRQGIGLEPFLHAYRIAQAEYWEACSRQWQAQDSGRGSAFVLGSRLHEAMDTITAQAAEGYLREEMQVSLRSGRATRDLVERLIAGGSDVPRRPVAAPGLDLDVDLLVAVARVAGGPSASVDGALEGLRVAIEGALPGRARPLVALRQGELVLVAAGKGWAGRTREAVEAARASVAAEGTELRVGLGGPGAGAESVPRAYRDAQLALSYTTAGRPLLALGELGSLQSALAAADLTTRQVIAAQGAAFAALPEATRAHVAETVRAFAAADLNVSTAAADLGLHPNTLRYRLERIAEQTGHDPRTFAGLVELTCVIETG
jgi:hypothetical protein